MQGMANMLSGGDLAILENQIIQAFQDVTKDFVPLTSSDTFTIGEHHDLQVPDKYIIDVSQIEKQLV